MSVYDIGRTIHDRFVFSVSFWYIVNVSEKRRKKEWKKEWKKE